MFHNNLQSGILSDILFIILLFACSIVCGIPAAIISISIHFLGSAFSVFIYISALIILFIFSFYAYIKGRGIIGLIPFILLIFISIPLLFIAGSPLLMLVEWLTGIDGGEKYILGVFMYLCVPVISGYFSLAAVCFIYKGKSVFKKRFITALIYFAFTIIFGFALLIKAYIY